MPLSQQAFDTGYNSIHQTTHASSLPAQHDKTNLAFDTFGPFPESFTKEQVQEMIADYFRNKVSCSTVFYSNDHTHLGMTGCTFHRRLRPQKNWRGPAGSQQAPGGGRQACPADRRNEERTERDEERTDCSSSRHLGLAKPDSGFSHSEA